MTKKLTQLTPAQRDRMASFAQEWIDYGWRTTPLTEWEWAAWEAGARKCYFNERDAFHAARIAFGADSDVYLRQADTANVELRRGPR